MGYPIPAIGASLRSELISKWTKKQACEKVNRILGFCSPAMLVRDGCSMGVIKG